MSVHERRRPIVLLILLSVAAVVAQVYYTRVIKPNLEVALERNDKIVAGTEVSPYRYRVLVPFVAEGLTRLLSLRTPRPTAFRLSYRILDPCAVVMFVLFLFWWLAEWFPDDQALVGVLFVAATIPIALQDHDFQPWSLPEAALFTGALVAIHRKRFWLVAAIVALATLNRETAFFIPVAFFLMTVGTRPFEMNRENRGAILRFLILLVIWAVIFVGLRLARGTAPPLQPLADLFRWNRDPESLRRAVTNWTLFLGAFWIFALLGIRSAPRSLRRLALLIPLYLVTVLIWGVWFEVRLLMTLYAVIVPLALFYIYGPVQTASGD